MRKLLILVVFCLGAFWLYHRYRTPAPVSGASGSVSAEHGSQHASGAAPFIGPAPGGFALPDKIIWNQTSHRDSRPGKTAEVVLIDGKRWRTESRVLPSAPITVCVFDGVKFACSIPVESTPAGPALAMRRMISALNGLRPVEIAECHGHLCWLYKLAPDAQGVRCNIWVDTQARFPVLVEEWSASGFHGEIDYSSMSYDTFAAAVAAASGKMDAAQPVSSKFNLDQVWPMFFDIQETDPMFAYFITPATAAPSMSP